MSRDYRDGDLATVPLITAHAFYASTLHTHTRTLPRCGVFSARVYSVIVASVVLDYADLDPTSAGFVFDERVMFSKVHFSS